MTKSRCYGALILACLASAAFAAELPGTDGKLDYGVDDLPVPPPVYVNKTAPRTADLVAANAKAETVPFLKMALLTELGECRLPQSVPGLVAALDHADAGVRAAAAHAIAISGTDDTRSADARKALLADSRLIGKLQSLISDKDPQVAVGAFAALRSLQGNDSPAINTGLSSDVGELLLAAIEASNRPEHAKTIAARLDRIPADLAPRAILALGRCGDPSQASILISKLKSSDIQQVVTACQAVAQLAVADAAPELQRLASADHPSIRREAIRAFNKCSAGGRVELATAHLNDADPTVRQAAVEVIGMNLRPDAVASLIPQLSTDYRPLYLATREALNSAKDEATRQVCITETGKLLNDPSPRRQEDGSYVLGHYRSDYMIERHIQLLDFSMAKPDWVLIQQVSLSTGRIGRQEARPALVKIVNSRDKLIAADPMASIAVNAAIIGAGRLGASEILPACDRILAEDPLKSDGNARLAAAFAIGVAADPNYKGINRLFGAVHNEMDAAKIEALKAIGNLKLKGAESRIQEFPGSESAQAKWLIQWVTARCTGQPEKHPPTVYSWSTRPSVSDVAEYK